MAGWDEIQRAFRGSFVLDRDDDHELVLTIPVNERAQRVMVHHYVVADEGHLEIRSAFAEFEGEDPIKLLEENLSLPLGAIAKHGRFLVLVQRITLQYASADEVIHVTSRVARVADWLESRHGGDRF